MKKYEKLYAVREKSTQKLISKRQSNPFFTCKKNAERYIEDMDSRYWGYKNEDLEVVTFKIEEVEDE